MIDRLLELKNKVKEFNEEILEIENKLIESVELPYEGSTTGSTDGYALKFTRGVARKINKTGAKELHDLLDEDLYPFTWEAIPKLDIKKFRYIQEHKPAILKILAKAITEKPRKVKIEIGGKNESKSIISG